MKKTMNYAKVENSPSSNNLNTEIAFIAMLTFAQTHRNNLIPVNIGSCQTTKSYIVLYAPDRKSYYLKRPSLA